MSGTEAAATLSLEINTNGAEAKLATLKENYEALQKALATQGASGEVSAAARTELDAIRKELAATKAAYVALNDTVENFKSRVNKPAEGAGTGLFTGLNKDIERSESNLKIMLNSAEMTGKAAVSSLAELHRAKNLANSLELRVIAAEEAGKIREASKATAELHRAKNLANSLELRVIAAEEAGKIREASKATAELHRAKNLANSLELRVIAAEEAGKIREASKATAELYRAKNLANSLELRVIAAEEAGKIREASKATAELHRAKNLANSLELRVIAAEEAGKIREASKATAELYRAKNLANSLELRVIAAEEAGKIREASKATAELHRAKNLANSLELRVIAAEEAGKIREASKATAELHRAKNLANSLELRVIAAEEAGKIREASKATAELYRAKNLANSLELRVIAAEEAGKIREASKATAELYRAKNLANSLELKVISNEEAAKLKAVRKDAEDLAKWLALTEKQRASATLQASKALYGGAEQRLLPGVAGSSQALSAAQNLGSVTAAKAALDALATSHTAVGTAAKEASAHQLHWNSIANEGHAAARGLSGSLGMLWMTYGQVAPLLAGAALGAGFKEATKAGAEFAYQLTFVKALGGESAAAVAEIGTAALTLSKSGMYGPVELANGLRILSQAGLSAKDALTALPSAMALATVGEMSMEQASITLTGVMNAFSLSLSDMPHIGDVFAKAAALSQTSVVGMTEAMKTASVVGEQYGASMEDTATAITLLAKVNISGTAAGTSFRNMLKELYSPGKGASEVMKDLGLSTKNAQGELRPFADVVYELKGKLEKFDKASQVNILQKLFGERGAKEAIAMLSKTREEWDKLHDKIATSDGFMNKVTTELEMTTKGRFQQALNTMKANLVSAFDSSEGSVRGLADSLRSLADSPAFVAGINAIVGSMASLAKVLVDMGPILLGFGAAWAVFKGASLAVAGITAATGAIAGLGVTVKIVADVVAASSLSLAALRTGLGMAGSAAGVAAGASGVGMLTGALTLLTNPVTWVVAGLGALALSLSYAKDKTPDSVKAMETFNDVLDRQLIKLKESNKVLAENLRLKLSGSAVDTETANKELVAARKAVAEATPNLGKGGQEGRDAYAIVSKNRALIAKAEASLKEASGEQWRSDTLSLNTFIADAEQGIKDIGEQAKRVGSTANTSTVSAILNAYKGTSMDQAALRTLKGDIEHQMAEARADAMKSGKQTYSGADSGGSDALAEIRKQYEGEVKAIQDGAKLKLAALDAAQASFEINEVEAIERETRIKVAAHKEAQEKYEQELAALKKAGAKGSALKDLQTKIQAEIAAVELTLTEGETKVATSAAKFEKALDALEMKAFKKDGTTALDEARKQVTEFAKAVAAHGPLTEEASARIAKAVGMILGAARDKDKAKETSEALNTLQNNIADLSSEVSALEAGMARDGGWIARIMGTKDIEDLIATKLPALRKEMEKLWEFRDSDSAEGKRFRAAQKEYDKLANYVPSVWKDIVKNVDDVFHSGFKAIFAKGKTDWKAFGKDLASSFKTTVMDAIYQMLARPFIMNIIANVAGAMGMSSAANAATSAAGTVGGIGNMVSGGSSLINTFTGGSNSLFSTIGTSSLLADTAFGAGLQYVGANGILSGLTSLPTLLSAGEPMLALGAALPGIGTAIAAIALITSLMGKGGGPKTEGNSYGVINSGGGLDVVRSADWAAPYGDGNWGRPGADAARIDALLAPVGASIFQTVKSLGGSAAGLGLALGYNTDPQGDAPDNINAGVRKSDGTWAYHRVYDTERGKSGDAMALEFQRLTLAAISAADGIPKIFKTIIAGIDLTTASAEQMTATLTQITNTKTIIDFTKFDPFESWRTAQETASAGVMGAWDKQRDAVSEMVKAFDGSAAATANLAAGVTALATTETQVVAYLNQSLAALRANTQTDAEGMYLSTLSNKDQYAYRQGLSGRLEGQMGTATTPEQVMSLYNQLRTNYQASYGLLDSSQQAAEGSKYFGTLNQSTGQFEGGYLGDLQAMTERFLAPFGETLASSKDLTDPNSLSAQIATAFGTMPDSMATAAAALESAAASFNTLLGNPTLIEPDSTGKTADITGSGDKITALTISTEGLTQTTANISSGFNSVIQQFLSAAAEMNAAAAEMKAAAATPVTVDANVNINATVAPGVEVNA